MPRAPRPARRAPAAAPAAAALALLAALPPRGAPRGAAAGRRAAALPGGASPCEARPAGEFAEQKRRLLEAVAATRRSGRGGGDAGAVFDAAQALEDAAAAAGVAANGALVDGDWTLVFSEQEPPGGGLVRLAGGSDDSIIDRLTAQVYRFFFRFAPALAGAQGGGAAEGGRAPAWWGSVRNEQTVDLRRGSVRNVVEVTPPAAPPAPPAPPAPWRLRITVEGEATPEEAGGDATRLRIVFTRFGAGVVGDTPPWLPRLPDVPLPRPTGRLVTAFVDDDLRVSRGGRGGLFVLRRRRPAQGPAASAAAGLPASAARGPRR